MALYANLRDYKFSEDADDIRGAEITGINNEKLGSIDDVIFDHATGDMRYVVVDTGGWLSSHRFLLPVRQIMTETEGAERSYRVALRKEQVERFPAYEEQSLDHDEEFTAYQRKYEDAYKLTSSGDVLHREGSANIVTPSPDEMPAAGGTRRTPSVGSPKRIAADMPRFGATSDSESDSNISNAGYDSRPLQPVGSLTPRGRFRAEETERAEAEVNEQLRADRESGPVTLDRSEFLKDGTLRSEYDAPREEIFIDETQPAAGSVADDADINGYAPDGGARFRKFQERLRKEREEILRKRDARKAA